MSQKHIRAGSGFGDSIYLQSVVRHLVLKGENLIVRSDFPDLFKNLKVPVVKFDKTPPVIAAHYSTRKSFSGTDQFQDCCIAAGITEPVEMRLDWVIESPDILARQTIPGKQKYTTLAVMLPRNPMDRKDGFGAELKPDYSIIDRLLKQHSQSIVTVQIGAGKPLYEYEAIDINAANQTTIANVLDIASLVDGFVGYCSFMIPLAESLGKPFFALWSSKGLASRTNYIRTITPEKIIHRKDLGFYAVDDSPQKHIDETFTAFLQKVTR